MIFNGLFLPALPLNLAQLAKHLLCNRLLGSSKLFALDLAKLVFEFELDLLPLRLPPSIHRGAEMRLAQTPQSCQHNEEDSVWVESTGLLWIHIVVFGVLVLHPTFNLLSQSVNKQSHVHNNKHSQPCDTQPVDASLSAEPQPLRTPPKSVYQYLFFFFL